MNAEEARNQTNNAYEIYYEDVLKPRVNKKLPSILERIKLRTMDKMYTVNIAVPLKDIYELSPSKTPYRKIKKDALSLLFNQLEDRGYKVSIRTGATVLSRILWKYEVKTPLIRITW